MAATPEGVVSLLGGAAADRAQVYALLEACGDDALTRLGCAALPSLVGLLAADADDVSHAEWPRVAFVICSLQLRGDETVCGEVAVTDFGAFYQAEKSVLGQTLAKSEAALSLADVIALSGICAIGTVVYMRAVTPCIARVRAPVTPELDMGWFVNWCATPLIGKTSDAFNLRLIKLSLDLLLRGPAAEGGRKLSGREQFGVWSQVWTLAFGRPTLCRGLLEESSDFIDLATGAMRQGTATEWIDFRKASAACDGFLFGGVLAAVKDVAEGAAAGGYDPMPRLLRSGFFDVVVELARFRSSEVRGR